EVKRQKILTWSFIGGFILVALMAFLILRGYFQKRRANALLAEQKEEIQTMNEQLQESLGEKEVLLKEIHHRVKNNLQIISSLLNLQSRDVSDEAVQDAVKEGQSRVKSMALIHQMLYQSEQISCIRFGEYLEQLTSSLASMYRGQRDIQCKVSADGIELDIDTAIPLGLIINELVSNSYKYAFAGRASGKITIELVKSNGSYTLEVSDNGIGMPEDASQGNTNSLGIKLVNILTSQLGGILEQGTAEGTSFIIKFEETR
ncbi:sensor histidine kinase, partial [Bacteroidota bacterium]